MCFVIGHGQVRTLCVLCHAGVTAEQASARAADRRSAALKNTTTTIGTKSSNGNINHDSDAESSSVSSSSEQRTCSKVLVQKKRKSNLRHHDQHQQHCQQQQQQQSLPARHARPKPRGGSHNSMKAGTKTDTHRSTSSLADQLMKQYALGVNSDDNSSSSSMKAHSKVIDSTAAKQSSTVEHSTATDATAENESLTAFTASGFDCYSSSRPPLLSSRQKRPLKPNNSTNTDTSSSGRSYNSSGSNFQPLKKAKTVSTESLSLSQDPILTGD